MISQQFKKIFVILFKSIKQAYLNSFDIESGNTMKRFPGSTSPPTH